MRPEWMLTGAPLCHSRVASAIRSGLLKHPVRDGLRCADCGCAAVEYDHRDYNEPLQVEPVCRRCNLLRGPAKRREWTCRHPEALRSLRGMCRQPVVPWAKEWCLERIEFLVMRIEQATDGKVTRYELRPDVFGKQPERAA